MMTQRCLAVSHATTQTKNRKASEEAVGTSNYCGLFGDSAIEVFSLKKTCYWLFSGLVSDSSCLSPFYSMVDPHTSRTILVGMYLALPNLSRSCWTQMDPTSLMDDAIGSFLDFIELCCWTSVQNFTDLILNIVATFYWHLSNVFAALLVPTIF